MSLSIETQSPCRTPSREDIDWDFWLEFPSDAAPSQQLRQLVDDITPQLRLRTTTWQSENENPSLRSPRLLVSNTPTDNSFRPYGIPSPSPDQGPGGCYFTIGNSLSPQTTASSSSTLDSSLASESVSVSSSSILSQSPVSATTSYNVPYQSSGFDVVPNVLANYLPLSAQPRTVNSQSYSPSSTHSLATEISEQIRNLQEPQLSSSSKRRKVSMDKPVFVTHYAGQAGVMMQFGKLNRGRRAMPAERRIGYRDTRIKGSCAKCKAQKRRCNRICAPYIECLLTKPLNFLDAPVNARLFRSRPDAAHPLFSAKVEIYNLEDLSWDTQPISVPLSQGFGLLEVEVCEFRPHPDLKTSHIYSTTTGRYRVELPRFCLASAQRTKADLEFYVNASWCRYLREIILQSDDITQQFLQEAQRHCINSSSSGPNCLVRQALMLLAVNRMIELSWTVSGPETLGIPLLPSVDTPGRDQRPVTPVMDTQLDQIIIQTILLPLRSSLLQDLEAKMRQGRKEDWFETVLVVFILTTNTGLLLKHSRKNAVVCGARHRYNSLPLAEEYFHASNILLAHFHHMFNGAAARLLYHGVVREGGLREYQQRFLERIVPAVHARRENMLLLRERKEYESALYWSHQMFFEGWIPESKSVG